MTCTVQAHVMRSRCQGFSLVESLVALVVLSIGLLGIAALHVEGLRSGRSALTRTTAVTLAADMADRIRANRLGRLDYETVVAATDTNAACKPGGAGCTASQLALHDKAMWIGSIQRALPGGTGTVDYDDTNLPATYTISITWSEVGATTPSSYTLRIQA